MSEAIQTSFEDSLFGDFLKVEQAAWLLDGVSRDHVLNLILDGRLRGIDISTAHAADPAKSAGVQREIRVYHATVMAMRFPKMAERAARLNAEAVLPHFRDRLLRREVARLLNATDRHVANLQLAKQLTGPRDGTTGSDRTPRIDRTSLIDFLTTREIRD